MLRRTIYNMARLGDKINFIRINYGNYFRRYDQIVYPKGSCKTENERFSDIVGRDFRYPLCRRKVIEKLSHVNFKDSLSINLEKLSDLRHIADSEVSPLKNFFTNMMVYKIVGLVLSSYFVITTAGLVSKLALLAGLYFSVQLLRSILYATVQCFQDLFLFYYLECQAKGNIIVAPGFFRRILMWIKAFIFYSWVTAYKNDQLVLNDTLKLNGQLVSGSAPPDMSFVESLRNLTIASKPPSTIDDHSSWVREGLYSTAFGAILLGFSFFGMLPHLAAVLFAIELMFFLVMATSDYSSDRVLLGVLLTGGLFLPLDLYVLALPLAFGLFMDFKGALFSHDEFMSGESLDKALDMRRHWRQFGDPFQNLNEPTATTVDQWLGLLNTLELSARNLYCQYLKKSKPWEREEYEKLPPGLLAMLTLHPGKQRWLRYQKERHKWPLGSDQRLARDCKEEWCVVTHAPTSISERLRNGESPRDVLADRQRQSPQAVPTAGPHLSYTHSAARQSGS